MAPVPDRTSAICLIENRNGKFSVNPEAKKILETISQKLVVVSIVGPYRSGKSYLLNKLAGIKCGGFDLGHTVEAKTKGIWMLCVPHPKKEDHTLVLLDTEGLGDVDKGDTRNDVAVFSLAVLLSSALVYNTRGTIDHDSVETLYKTAELCECFASKIPQHNKPSADSEDMEVGSLVNLFIWAVRDFGLQLELPGRPVTEDEYLENSLQDLTTVRNMETVRINEIRKTIRKRFPVRRCFAFDCPFTNKRKQDADTHFQSEFVEKTRSFCQFIYESAEVKTISGGQVVTGCILGHLLDAYIKVAASGQISFLEDSISTFYLEHNKSAVQSAADLYKKQMMSKYVDSEKDFQDLHVISEEMALKHITDTAIFYKREANEDLLEIIKKHKAEIWKNHEESSSKRCRDLIHPLNQSMLQAIDLKKYHVLGGHKTFLTDREHLIQKYNQEPGKGIKAEEILQEYMKSLADVEKIILQCELAIAERPKVTNPSNYSQLRAYICGYKLQSQCYHRILIQLFGFTGHGKSSFVNSCMYVIGNEGFKDLAGEGQSYGGKTMDRRSYKLTDCITMVDNRGFKTMDSSEAWEVYAQLCNFVPLNQYVKWEKSRQDKIKQLTYLEGSDAELTVPVFVYSSEKSLNDAQSNSIKQFLKHAQHLTRVLPFVIKTKKLSENAQNFRERFGMENVYTLENYTRSDPIATRGRHLVFLTFLKEVLDTVDYLLPVLEESRLMQEERKQFLMKMAFN